MDVVYDDARAGFRRIEMLTGPARRRRWSVADKGRIVAETLQAGASVTEVARRWQVCPQQVWGWRREAREGRLVLPGPAGAAAGLGFVPIVAEAAPMAAPARSDPALARQKGTAKPAAAPGIEVHLTGAVVRVAAGTDGAWLAEVLRAVRASAA